MNERDGHQGGSNPRFGSSRLVFALPCSALVQEWYGPTAGHKTRPQYTLDNRNRGAERGQSRGQYSHMIFLNLIN